MRDHLRETDGGTLPPEYVRHADFRVEGGRTIWASIPALVITDRSSLTVRRPASARTAVSGESFMGPVYQGVSGRVGGTMDPQGGVA